MILQALTRYYDLLAADPDCDIPWIGYSTANVSFALNLSTGGELMDILRLLDTVPRGKKTVEVPRRMVVPEQAQKSVNIKPDFLCGNSAYVLGLSGKEAKDPEYCKKRFEAFRQFNQEMLERADCEEAKAVIRFLGGYDPGKAMDNPLITKHLEDLQKGGNLVFKVEGRPGFVHEVAEIRGVWEEYAGDMTDIPTGQCLVTGEIAPIERLHPKLKGIRDAQSTGASLVSFNERAYESYNKTERQGLNAPVSKKAAFAYTTMLNFLLSRENKNSKINLGDTTVVYWAESPNKAYSSLVNGLFEPEPAEEGAEDEAGEGGGRDRKAEERLKEIGRHIQEGRPVEVDWLLEGLDGETQFYVLGLSPNAGRVSVRFFHTDPFRKIVQKMLQHYVDLQIEKEFENEPDLIPPWRILDETVSRKASVRKPAPLLGGAVMRAVLDQTPYPAALYYAMINRVRADVDDKKTRISKINYVRAAVIKAYLTRKYHHRNNTLMKEVLCMSLNEQSTNQAYLLGRLFAVLEKAQKDAIPGLNATIKDRYFTSACATPAAVFPVLLRLSQHHIAKAEYGYTSDKRIETIMGLLEVENNPFPAHLTLDEQGIFVLGYYHQRADFFKPKNGAKDAEQSSSAD